MPAPLEIKVLTIDPVSWTPVTIPFDCTCMVVKNAGANGLKMRTTQADANTEDALAAGSEQALAIPFPRYRFLSGTQPLFLQSDAGTGPAVIKFLS